MVNIFLSAPNKQMTGEMIKEQMNSFPNHLKRSIIAYKNIQDQSARLYGILLLDDYLHTINDPGLSLKNLTYNSFGKPEISGIYFSISHTENISLIAASITNNCGIDIEKIRSTDVSIYHDYFTKEEWNAINNTTNELYKTFYTLWTRKEAIIKTLGTGITEAFKNIDVLDDIVFYNNQIFHLYSIDIHPDYCCSLATTVIENEIIVSKKVFNF